MSFSKIFFYFCLSFIIGVFVGSLDVSPRLYLPGFLFFVLLAISVFISKRHFLAITICFCFAFLLAGVWRCQVYSFNLEQSPLKNYNGQQTTLLGKILAEPDIKLNNVQITLDAQKIAIGDKILPISGKVLIATDKYPEYNYADILVMKGTLKTPENFDNFNYQDYLAKKGIFSQMSWPKIQIARKESYSNIWQFGYGQILSLKNKIRNNIDRNFPFLQAKLFSGILLGGESGLPQDLKDKMSVAGLSYITAIDGLHIAILCSLVMVLLLAMGFWRGQAFYLTVIFIFLFILMAGFHPSAIRAAIMGTAALLAQKFGRLSNAPRLIVFVAAGMLLADPMAMWDAGFQLSFLAVTGIIYLSRPALGFLKNIFGKRFLSLLEMLSVTISAQIFTLPILVLNFGRISLAAPLTSLLVVPFLGIIIICGFVFSSAALISGWLGWIFAWPCWLLASYIIEVIDIFSKPWAARTIQNVSWVWLLVYYLALAILTLWLIKKSRMKFLDY